MTQTILDVEKRSKNIGRPLCTAAQYESLRCMCLLLKSGFNLEVRIAFPSCHANPEYDRLGPYSI